MERCYWKNIPCVKMYVQRDTFFMCNYSVPILNSDYAIFITMFLLFYDLLYTRGKIKCYGKWFTPQVSFLFHLILFLAPQVFLHWMVIIGICCICWSTWTRHQVDFSPWAPMLKVGMLLAENICVTATIFYPAAWSYVMLFFFFWNWWFLEHPIFPRRNKYNSCYT